MHAARDAALHAVEPAAGVQGGRHHVARVLGHAEHCPVAGLRALHPRLHLLRVAGEAALGDHDGLGMDDVLSSVVDVVCLHTRDLAVLDDELVGRGFEQVLAAHAHIVADHLLEAAMQRGEVVLAHVAAVVVLRRVLRAPEAGLGLTEVEAVAVEPVHHGAALSELVIPGGELVLGGVCGLDDVVLHLVDVVHGLAAVVAVGRYLRVDGEQARRGAGSAAVERRLLQGQDAYLAPGCLLHLSDARARGAARTAHAAHDHVNVVLDRFAFMRLGRLIDMEVLDGLRVGPGGLECLGDALVDGGLDGVGGNGRAGDGVDGRALGVADARDDELGGVEDVARLGALIDADALDELVTHRDGHRDLTGDGEAVRAGLVRAGLHDDFRQLS